MTYEPDYGHWSKRDAIKVWEAAYLMRGYDPRAADCIMDHDPHDPKSVYGAPPDLSEELQFLNSAVQAGTVTPTGNASANGDELPITRESLIAWLDRKGYASLAKNLCGTSSSSTAASGPSVPSSAPAQRPVPKQQWRQQTILDAIKALGLDPQSFPKNEKGKPGFKKQVRDKLIPSADWSGTTFDGTWQDLRDLKEIVDEN